MEARFQKYQPHHSFNINSHRNVDMLAFVFSSIWPLPDDRKCYQSLIEQRKFPYVGDEIRKLG